MDWREAKKRFNFDVEQKFSKEIQKLEKQGLIEYFPGEKIRLSEKGLDLANVVWREFL